MRSFSFFLIAFRLFYYEYKEMYPSDYFRELVSKLKKVLNEYNDEPHDLSVFYSLLLQNFLQSSKGRFNFVKEFVTFLKKFEI